MALFTAHLNAEVILVVTVLREVYLESETLSYAKFLYMDNGHIHSPAPFPLLSGDITSGGRQEDL